MTRITLLLFAALAVAGCSGIREKKVIYGVGSYGRHSVVPRLGMEARVSNSTKVRAVWLPEFPIYGPGEPQYSSRAPSRELGGFEIECSTDLP